MKPWLIKTLLGVLILSCLVAAQAPQECAAVLVALEQKFEAQRVLLSDWAGLIRYGSENSELPKPKPEESRVVR
jgi:hypothetical protein